MMERWQQIQSVFQKALERDPAERNAWLREACQLDPDLRREVASLLANHHSFADSQLWAAAVAAKLIDNPASLEPGRCLGPYRIECFLAAGGMGKVYRATDTRLHRQVAVKIASSRFSERFERGGLRGRVAGTIRRGTRRAAKPSGTWKRRSARRSASSLRIRTG
jgi:serine/threonine-protein kinase